jgi:Ankyrin repeats (3 copies)
MNKLLLTALLAVMTTRANEETRKLGSLALFPRDIEKLKELIAQGADVHTNHEEALFNAVDRGNVEAIKALIEAGADVNAKQHKSGDTVLHDAIKSDRNFDNKLQVIEVLFNAGAETTELDKQFVINFTKLFPFEPLESVKSLQAALSKVLSVPKGGLAYKFVDKQHYNAPKDVYEEMQKHEKDIDMNTVD